MLKVVIPEDFTGEDSGWKKWLRSRGYEIISGNGDTDIGTMQELLQKADAVFARSSAAYSREVIEAATNLRVIARYGVGTDNIDIEACTENGVYVTITPLGNYVSVAEHAIGLMIACAHQFQALHSGAATGDWDCRNRIETHMLHGKTLGVIGLGRIGSRVALMAEAGLGMNILGYDPFVSKAEGVRTLKMAADLEELYREADVISLHLPFRDELHKMIDEEVLGKMKKTAILINTARGGFIDEAALFAALQSRRILAAGLDARYTEPPEDAGPLYQLSNCICTPHASALTVEAQETMGMHAAMEIDRVLSGKEPKWACNQPVRSSLIRT